MSGKQAPKNKSKSSLKRTVMVPAITFGVIGLLGGAALYTYTVIQSYWTAELDHAIDEAVRGLFANVPHAPATHWFLVGVAMVFGLTSNVLPLYFRAIQRGGPNNSTPRTQVLDLSGAGARALGTHHNYLEAFQFLLAAVVVAHECGVPSLLITRAITQWLALRVLYVVIYMADLGIPRTFTWMISSIVIVNLALGPFLGTLAVSGTPTL